MAQQLNPDSAAQGHNSQNRTVAIQQALEQIFLKDREIARLIEQHIADLRQDKRDIKKRLRDDHEITPAMFNVRYTGYKKEREAKDAGDDKVADTIRELYEICPVGHQVSLIDALQAD